ncbi:MAG TPA: hypothetical protein VI685_07380 [Candidatus Angelobacter sp.]
MKIFIAVSMSILLGITTFFCCGCKRKHTILAGTDYLKTLPDSSFELPLPGGTKIPVTFVGNPQSGNAYDTAITRLDDVSIQPGGSGKTRLQVTELSLKSDKPVAIKGQQYNVSVTLDPNKPSMGAMTLTEDANAKGSGTFTSSFDQINFVVAFEPIEKGEKLPEVHLSSSLVNDGTEAPASKWVSNAKQANPPCTMVTPKPRDARDTNQHSGKSPDDFDIFPNGQINENHNHTSRWHRAACI